MIIKRENKIFESECDNSTIYELIITFYGTNIFYRGKSHISVCYDIYFTNYTRPILDEIIYEFNRVVYRSKDKESLKFQENIMFKKLQVIIQEQLVNKKEEILLVEAIISELEDAFETLKFRKEKFKKLLNK